MQNVAHISNHGPSGDKDPITPFRKIVYYLVATVTIFQLVLTFVLVIEQTRQIVPDVVGMKYARAVEVIHSKNLRSQIIFENSESIPENEVIRTDPIANISIPKKATVTIYVSAGHLEE